MKQLQCFRPEKISKHTPIVLYGMGNIGNMVYTYLCQNGYEKVTFCDTYKAGQFLYGSAIQRPTDLVQQNKAAVIVLCLTKRAFFEVADFLDKMHMDYYSAEAILRDIDFSSIPILSFSQREQAIRNVYLYDITIRKYYIYKNIVQDESLRDFHGYIANAYHAQKADELHRLTLLVTDRCSLRCKKCSHLIPYFDVPQDADFEEITKSLNRFLDCVGYVETLQIVGGKRFFIEI